MDINFIKGVELQNTERTSLTWGSAKEGDKFPPISGILDGVSIEVRQESSNEFYGMLDGARLSNEEAERMGNELYQKKLIEEDKNKYIAEAPPITEEENKE